MLPEYPLHHVTYAPAKFEIATSNILGGDIHYSTFDLEVNVTWNVTQYPLHHVTYAPEMFKVNTSNGLGGQENTSFDLEVKVTRNVAQNPVHHVTYTPTKFKVSMSKGLGDAFTRKYIIWPLTLGSRSQTMLTSTLYNLHHIHLQNLKLLRPMVKEEMHLQENISFDLWLWPLGKG